jgi:hypothetical protein
MAKIIKKLSKPTVLVSLTLLGVVFTLLLVEPRFFSRIEGLRIWQGSCNLVH